MRDGNEPADQAPDNAGGAARAAGGKNGESPAAASTALVITRDPGAETRSRGRKPGPGRAQKLTLKLCEAVKPGERLWDRDVPGLVLRGNRTTPRGTWLLHYVTLGRRSRWLKLGGFPTLGPEEARRVARPLRALAERGEDPAAHKRLIRQNAAVTLAGLAQDYAAELPRRSGPRGPLSDVYVRDEQRGVWQALRLLEAEGLTADGLAPRHGRRIVDHLAKQPAKARHVFGAFQRFLDWVVERGHLASNPLRALAGGRMPKPPPPRSRLPTLPEVQALWQATAALPGDWRDLARLLLMLPARRGEVARMDWRTVNLAEAWWEQPGRQTKNGEPHRLPLPMPVLALLTERWKRAGRPSGGLVVPNSKGAVFNAWPALHKALVAASGVTGWSFHDLRRAFVTHLAELGVPEVVADALLNHRQSATRGGVLGVYQKAQHWPARVEAINAWAAAIMAGQAQRYEPGEVRMRA